MSEKPPTAVVIAFLNKTENKLKLRDVTTRGGGVCVEEAIKGKLTPTWMMMPPRDNHPLGGWVFGAQFLNKRNSSLFGGSFAMSLNSVGVLEVIGVKKYFL